MNRLLLSVLALCTVTFAHTSAKGLAAVTAGGGRSPRHPRKSGKWPGSWDPFEETRNESVERAAEGKGGLARPRDQPPAPGQARSNRWPGALSLPLPLAPSLRPVVGSRPGRRADSGRDENRSSRGGRLSVEGVTLANTRSSPSLLYHFNIIREGDHDKQTCGTDCRKERNERDSYCGSEFAISAIVHGLEPLGRGVRLVTVLVDSRGLYRAGRLYLTPDGFFFKAHVLVIDPLGCRRPCPDLRFGSRYIMMGQIYHRRYSLPARAAGRLRPGDGLVKSGSYVKRYNRRRDHKLRAAECRGPSPGAAGK